jgi:hypothetical protein
VDRGPGGEDRDGAEESGQQDEEGADPVHSEVIGDPDRRDPGGLLLELEARLAAIEPEPEGQAHQEADEGHDVGEPAHRVVVLLEDGQEQQERSHQGGVGDDREDVQPEEIHRWPPSTGRAGSGRPRSA